METQTRKEKVEVSQEDRETVRSMLTDVAEFVRKKYDWAIPEINTFLHEMLEVSV